jgi:hypothetical protein
MMKNNENKIESRRNFLKKAAYAVPTVIAISQITNPLVAGASTIKGTTPSTTNPNVLTGAGETNPNSADNQQFGNLFKKK